MFSLLFSFDVYSLTRARSRRQGTLQAVLEGRLKGVSNGAA
jgi:hypothetical protein